MKPTDFAYYLTNFLSKYLPGTAGLSPNTIMSYRDTFSLFLDFCSVQKKIKPEKFSLNYLNRKLVEDYLAWLEKTRKCIVSTRNVRLSAFHSFCRYLQMEFPDYIHPVQQIISIPMKKAWPSETWPARPERTWRPSAPIAKIATLLRIFNQSLSERNPRPGITPNGITISTPRNTNAEIFCVHVGRSDISDEYEA